jgi:hypothetical protein
MLRKHLAVLGKVLGLFVLLATPAMANHVAKATAGVTCTNYTLTVSGVVTKGDTYTINYTIILTPTSGSSITVTDSITFTATKDTFDITVTKPLGPLNGDYTLSGSATLVGHNEIKIVFSPESINCTTPPPPPCTATSTNSSNFNGTPISAGDYIWFNANFSASGIPSSGVTVTLTKSTISFSAGGTNYNLMVPNAQITFSPSATCTSTSFDTMTNTWITTVPISGDDEIFLTGLAWPVPSGGLAGGVQPVAWEGTFSTDTPGISMNWKWGAAVYSTFTTDYNALAIKPAHNNACGLSNGDHAGTPEGVNNSNQPWKQFVVGGARGGGGSNWTGSWSGTLNVTPLCESSLVCPINRDHLIAQLF